MSLQEKKEISASGKIDVPSVGSLSGTVKTDELGNVSLGAEAKDVYGLCRVEGNLEVDGDKNVSGGGNVGINLNPIATANFHINVDKYGKFNTGVDAKLNFGIFIIGGHAEIDQNGQKSARVDIHSSMASNGNIGCNVENGEMSGGVSVEKNLDKIDVVIEKKSGNTNFSRTTDPVNEGPGQLTGERSGDFGGSIKIGDTNYQLDFSQPKYWSHLGQNTKLENLGSKLWTNGRSGDVKSKSLNLSNFCQFTKLENLETEHWTHGRSEDVVSSIDKIGDTNYQTDLMDKLMQSRDDKFSRPIILSNFGQNTKPVNIGTEHLAYGRGDDVGSYFLDTFKQTKGNSSSEPMNWSNFCQNTKLGNLGTAQRTHERRYDVGGSFGSVSPFTLSTQKSGWFN